jgi:DNA-binding NarL/FixJ family response regulator
MLTLDRAIDELDGHDLINARPLAMAARSWVAAQSGEVDHARILLDASVDAAAVDGRVRIQASIADVWCDLVEGDLPPGTIDRLSAERLLAMAGEAFDSAQALTAVIVLHELVRLGDPGTALNPLRQIAGELPPSWFVQFVTDRANAEAVQDDARLHRLAREAHHRWPLAAAEMHASRARIARSRRDSVAESRATVLSAIESVRLGPTQPWSLKSLRSPLTPRELEVASAVAAGTANRAVAEQAESPFAPWRTSYKAPIASLDLEGRQDLVALFNLSP